jgi:hypothetical protein
MKKEVKEKRMYFTPLAFELTNDDAESIYKGKSHPKHYMNGDEVQDKDYRLVFVHCEEMDFTIVQDTNDHLSIGAYTTLDNGDCVCEVDQDTMEELIALVEVRCDSVFVSDYEPYYTIDWSEVYIYDDEEFCQSLLTKKI